MAVKHFEGVPAGRVQVTPLPNVIFSEILPEVDDLAEAQVTLHIYYLLYRKKGSPRYVTLAELRADPTLLRALGHDGQPFDQALMRGLGKAEARGTLLHYTAEGEDWYFFNTAESRRALDKMERGELVPNHEIRRVLPPVVETPNIFKLYEQHIGPLTQSIAEELKQAERDYPPEIILDAFRIANENEARSWKYVQRILLNWTREATHEASGRNSKKRKPHFQGKFADIVKRRQD